MTKAVLPWDAFLELQNRIYKAVAILGPLCAHVVDGEVRDSRRIRLTN